MTLPGRHEFDLAETSALFDELDARLRDRGAAAALFVVGGVAVAATGARPDRLTEDVDAITSNELVADLASEIARERGLPRDWLNSRASMWMPPLPRGVLDPPAAPGLRVTWAEDAFLLATKLVAQRSKDIDDIVALAHRLGLGRPTAADLEAHVRRFYVDEGNLEIIIGGPDAAGELTLRCEEAAAAIRRWTPEPS